ncbi:hypothetical protein HRbin19_01067 [bacterium HR19]|nr:hypothetical protein HRbin19_01067 [bacterium HR19]
MIRRTFDGYQTERKTIYEQLQKILGVEIKPAPDEWDRVYNVDFYIEVNNKFIGIQIKPSTFEHAPDYERKWREIYKESHKKFTENFGGRVFIILSVKKDNKKEILNKEVIEEIRKEIEFLKKNL